MSEIIEIKDIYGMKHVLYCNKCREITFVHNLTHSMRDDEESKKFSYYVEYCPLQAYDTEFIYMTREEFLKHV